VFTIFLLYLILLLIDILCVTIKEASALGRSRFRCSLWFEHVITVGPFAV
jgi:hypothetical protein